MVLVFITLVATNKALLYILCSILTVVFPLSGWTQGNSVIRKKNVRQDIQAPSEWGASISFNSQQTLDEYERPYWGLGAGIGYSPWIGLEQNTVLSMSLDFSGPYAQEDADPELVQGIGDLAFGWSQAKIWTHETIGSLSSKVGLSLPTSEQSKRTSKIVGSSFGLSLGTPFWGALSRLKMSTGLSAGVSTYGYDYADAEGSSFNSPYSLSGNWGLALNIGWGLSLSGSYSTGQRYDYGGVWTPTQRFLSSLGFQATKSLGFSATYQWADRVYSNDPIFMQRKSSITGEMSYEF